MDGPLDGDILTIIFLPIKISTFKKIDCPYRVPINSTTVALSTYIRLNRYGRMPHVYGPQPKLKIIYKVFHF